MLVSGSAEMDNSSEAIILAVEAGKATRDLFDLIGLCALGFRPLAGYVLHGGSEEAIQSRECYGQTGRSQGRQTFDQSQSRQGDEDVAKLTDCAQF